MFDIIKNHNFKKLINQFYINFYEDDRKYIIKLKITFFKKKSTFYTRFKKFLEQFIFWSKKRIAAPLPKTGVPGVGVTFAIACG